MQDTPVEKVTIRAFGKQVYYLRDLPLHPSQEEVATEEDYSDFELTLRPTPDFYTPLLSSGIPPQVVMKWTGHSDYQAMKPYIEIAEKTKADAMKLFEQEMEK